MAFFFSESEPVHLCEEHTLKHCSDELSCGFDYQLPCCRFVGDERGRRSSRMEMDVLDRVSDLPQSISEELAHSRRGLFTLCVGIASFWLMPAAPSKTRTKHRPNGYFTEREEKIIVNRTIRDDPGKVCPLVIRVSEYSLTVFREECIIDRRSTSRPSGDLAPTTISTRSSSSVCCSICPLSPYRITSRSHFDDSGFPDPWPICSLSPIPCSPSLTSS